MPWAALVALASVAVSLMVWTHERLGLLDVAAGLFVVGALVAALTSGRLDASALALRSSLAIVGAYYLSRAMPAGRGTNALVLGLVSATLLAALAIVVLWAGSAASKVTALNAWLYDWMRSALHPSWSLPLDPANLGTAASALLTPFSFAFVWALAAQPPRWLRVAGVGALALILLVLSVRSAWIAVLASVVLYGALARGRALRVASVVVVASILAGAAAVVLAPSLFDTGSAAVRLETWAASLGALKDHLPFGLGPGMFPYYLTALWRGRPSAEVVTAPENGLLQLSGDAGLLGLVASLIVLAAVARGATRAARAGVIGRAAFVATAAYLVLGLAWSVSVLVIRTADEGFATVATPFPWLLIALSQRETTDPR